MTIVYAIILFVLLIFPHELGHFVVAKAVGVKVNEFAFGMGPAIYKRQKGETLYAIRLVPIGGYCAMEAENEASDDDRAFCNKPWWAKISVLLAGAGMNVLIAILVMSLIMGYVGSATTSIDKVQDASPAYEAGLETGDKILAVNDTEINSWQDLTAAIGKSEKSLAITVDRNGEELTLNANPQKGDDGRYIVGITPEISHNVFTAAKNGAKATWNMTVMMFDMLKQLITGAVPSSEIAGPIGMVTMVSETTNYGISYFGYLIALMSLNLAILNLLPIPALDGGRILFVFIRMITGRMISDDLEGKIHAAGMVLLLGLMVFATWNDITRLFT